MSFLPCLTKGRNLELESEVRELHSNLRALKTDLQDKVAELEQV